MINKIGSIEAALASHSENRQQAEARHLEAAKEVDVKNTEAVRYRNEIGQSVEELKAQKRLARELGKTAGSAFQALLEQEQAKLDNKN